MAACQVSPVSLLRQLALCMRPNFDPPSSVKARLAVQESRLGLSQLRCQLQHEVFVRSDSCVCATAVTGLGDGSFSFDVAASDSPFSVSADLSALDGEFRLLLVTWADMQGQLL